MRYRAAAALVLTTIMLQGCAAAIIPIVAAGALGKRQIDQGKKRARAAEAGIAEASRLPEPQLPIVEMLDLPPAAPGGVAADAIQQMSVANIQNAYTSFARYTLEQVGKRKEGLPLRSAVLVNEVSLIDPQTLPCENKPMAVVIDLDVAQGTPDEIEIEAQSGFGTLLQTLRESDVRIVWAGAKSAKATEPTLDVLRQGDNPALRDADMLLLRDGKFSKQEQRWILARSYCVLAVAGDRKADFDELYDFLRDPDYAIRLEAFMDRGWFLLPHPVAAMDSSLVKKELQ